MIETSSPTTAEPNRNGTTATSQVEQLRRLVEKNTTRWKQLIVLEAVGLVVSAPLGYLWLVFVLDNLLHLPMWARALACLCFVGVVAWLGRSLWRRRRTLFFTEDQVALAMEQHTPGGVQNRLINALQIGRDGKHSRVDFNEALIQENYDHLQKLHLQQAAHTKPALIRVGIAGALIGFGVLFWLLQPAYFSNAATRIFLPFADVDPLYRTKLIVEPGNIEAVGDIAIRIHIQGEHPAELTILKNVKGNRGTENIAVPAKTDMVAYTFKAVDQSMLYAVRGGDYTTPFYRIDVPTPAQLRVMRATYQYPEYTGIGEKPMESAGGDLEALVGSKAKVHFVFDQPASSASMFIKHAGAAEQEISLNQVSATEYTGELEFKQTAEYQLETRQADRPAYRSPVYGIRVLTDQDPKLQLTGLEKLGEVSVDAVLPVKVAATDDYGLEKVGLFYRRVGGKGAQVPSPKAAPAGDGTGKDDWTAAVIWLVHRGLDFQQTHDLQVTALGAVEGDRIEVALRAQDTDPAKAGRWKAGTVYRFLVGGEGVTLQIQYEQILLTEAEVKALIKSEQQAMDKAAEWGRKLDPAGGLRWDDQKNLDALAAAMKAQAKEQDQIRVTAGRVARDMVAEAGNLRLSLGMLADTEMARAVRILESVPTRDQPQAKRATLGDARLTAERTIRSMQEILEQYSNFRQEWELAHLVGFTKMLADRQGLLRDESRKRGNQQAAELQQNSAHRRQAKLVDLAQLAQVGFTGLVDRVKNLEPILARAFGEAAGSLSSEDLKGSMRQGAEGAKAGRWTEAAQNQAKAAELLTAIHARLRKAQTEAAEKALAALQEKAKSDAEAQKIIDKLKAGTAENFLDLSKKLKLEEIIHMRENEQKKGEGEKEKNVNDYLFPDSMRGILQQADTGKRQEFDILKLAKSPGTTPSFPKQSDRAGNVVKPHIQEKFDDLVGKLLEEADEMQEKYETYNLNAGVNINEPGEIGKQAGDLNSTAASAATGNMKPPTVNVGGASRSGRRGARAHGQVVGDESINRRGRDKVQEGQERSADQAGTIKEKPSEDMQKDTATGIGGKKVESDDNKFSVNDTGKFTEEMAKKLEKPQAKNYIVERQGDKLDPRVAEMLRDLNSNQEQMIERLKVLKKELKNLYLPTEHLDELMAELGVNLGKLRDRPNPETFRMQQQALDRLRGTLRVFHQAHAGFQPSVPRDQAVQGRVLDDPARQTYPGYEEAVKEYYQRLAGVK